MYAYEHKNWNDKNHAQDQEHQSAHIEGKFAQKDTLNNFEDVGRSQNCKRLEVFLNLHLQSLRTDPKELGKVCLKREQENVEE